MNGKTEFAETADMMPDHALFLALGQWRRLAVFEGLRCSRT
jgi:hypothetical protein